MATTREWDALVDKFGEGVAKVAADISGDVATLVRYLALNGTAEWVWEGGRGGWGQGRCLDWGGSGS